MTYDDFKEPQRVRIDAPSKFNPLHQYHGKVGIGVQRAHSTGYKEIVLYFTEGRALSMSVDPLYLVRKYD
jgi:hypothetical protein